MTIAVCLTLTWGGRVVRVATMSLDVSSTRDGKTYHYHHGLPAQDIGSELSLFEVADAPKLTTEASLPFAPADMLAAGHALLGELAEVAIYAGGDWDDREVWLLGRVSDYELTPGSRVVRLTISTDPADDSSTWPPVDAVVSDDTFPLPRVYDPAVEGKHYPWVFGHPGLLREHGTTGNVAATPALCVAGGDQPDSASDHWFVLAGHKIPYDGGREIILKDHTSGGSLTLSGPSDVYDIEDAQGRRVTIGLAISGGGLAYNPGDQVSAIWTTSGGLASAHGAGSMQTAGEVLEYALQRTTIPIDWRRMAVAIDSLRGYQIDGYWDESCSPWQWIRDNLLPILPISLRYGPDGLYPVVWRWWLGIEAASAYFEIGRNAAYASGPDVASDLVSRVTLAYARAVVDGSTYRATRIVQADTPSGMLQSRSLFARRAALRLATRELRVETDVVWQRQTAGRIVQWLLMANSIPYWTVEIDVSPERYIPPGQIVGLTWSAMGLTRAAGMVLGSHRRGPSQRLTLRISPPTRYA